MIAVVWILLAPWSASWRRLFARHVLRCRRCHMVASIDACGFSPGRLPVVKVLAIMLRAGNVDDDYGGRILVASRWHRGIKWLIKLARHITDWPDLRC